ncbi:MAG: coenzyme F420-0:L-glutamate ligase/coenzyme F420-1:gamma-L-glutamate ligase [Halieaceae bacterium]|jgi:coenzyme F420-0:L-glutamate ligase/coenzyme F420-1:gamma-L-glutamate ligase
MSATLTLIPLAGFPLVIPGDDVAELIAAALNANNLTLNEGDVLVIAQKIISKAEGRYVTLADVEPGEEAVALAAKTDKDPRQVELVLRESREVLRSRPGVIIVEHRNGYVHANAGIDRSNIETNARSPKVLLLPEDADRSAASIRQSLAVIFGVLPQIIVNDSFGRAWRNGTVGVAIGSAGLEPLYNQVGEKDLFDNTLEVTEAAVADELAAAASLVMGQAAEGIPVVLARGAQLIAAETDSKTLLRDKSRDMFR